MLEHRSPRSALARVTIVPMGPDRIGRYDVHEVLGIGGFATVFRATDPRLDAPVAIKVLAENWSLDPDVRARFRTEAVLLRRIQSEGSIPGVIEVFDIDQTEDGRPFFVMGYADGGTLAERAGRKSWTQGQVVPVIDALADTVGALHDADVVHRDLKPSNLLLRSDRRAPEGAEDGLVHPGERLVVGDLGLAKDLTAESTSFSVAGGTGRYMAPEQLDPTRPVDRRADIYAASELVASLLRGRDGSTSLAEETAAVLDRGRATSPSDRFGSMAEWRTALLGAFAESRARALLASDPLGDGPSSTTPVAAVGGSKEPDGKPKAIVGALIAIAGGLAAIVGGVVLTSEGNDTIVGPDAIEVGQTVRYRADADVDADIIWTDWTGAIIEQQDLEVTARLPGLLTFSLDVDGDTSERTIEVIESERGPTITGPAEIDQRVGGSAEFVAQLEPGDTSHFWIDPSGQRVDTDTLVLAAGSSGEGSSLTIALVATGADGIERGTRRVIEVNG